MKVNSKSLKKSMLCSLSKMLYGFLKSEKREYWKAHPEKHKEYMEQVDNKLESLKSEPKATL